MGNCKANLKRFLIIFYGALALIFICMTGFRLRLSHTIPLLVPLAMLEKRSTSFLAQWTPFYLLILLYDSFRGIADDLAARVEYVRLINWEKWLFNGQLPTLWLQQHFHTYLEGFPGRILAIFYFGHFILPLACLYWAWRKNHRAFLCCMISLCFLSLAGFVTFYLFPAAPPWLASHKGYLPPVQQYIIQHIEAISVKLPRIYVQMNSNPVAPFPSLHAGYPLLWLFCGLKYFPRRAIIPLLVNVIAVALAIVSFGEHYVVDVLAGWAYAAGSFFLMEYAFLPWLTKLQVCSLTLASKAS